jgi:capsular exopolysaccharide synthesis family protein
MDLRHYLRVLRKHLVLIVAATLLCAAGAVVTSLGTTPVYEGAAKLLIVPKTDPAGGVSSALQGTMLSQQLIESFAQILESRATAEDALRLDPVPLTPSQLQASVQAEPVKDTLLINLTVENADPTTAKRLTNSVARAFIASVPRLQAGSSLRVSLVEAALTPSRPVRPQTRLNVILGVLLGLTLGVGLAFLREFLDRSVRTPEELEAAAGFPVVGTIPPFKAAKEPLPVEHQPRTAVAEAFRKLRTNFAFLSVDRDSVCCVITSPNAADGKSTVAANLAVALAQSGQRVVLVDADLRKPSLHRLFDLPQRVGITTVLLDRADVHDALQHCGPGLPAVLTAGQLPPNPSELLGSQRMAKLLAELRAAYEVVLVDCAPLLPVTDPMVISQFADGVLLIARSGTTTRDHAAAVKAACAKAGATVFGSVLNASQVTEADQPATYAYYGETGKRSTTAFQANLDVIPGSDTRRPAHLENGRAARHRRVRSGDR